MEKTAKLVTNILSPYLVGPLLIALISTKYSDSTLEATIYTALFILLVLTPSIAYVLTQIKKEIISDIHIKNREQRHKAYLIGIVSLIVYDLTLIILKSPNQLIAIQIILLIMGATSYLINKRIKMSIHTATMAGASVLLWMLFDSKFGVIGVLLTGIVLWSRIKIKAHQPKETFLGVLVGGLITGLLIKTLEFYVHM